SRRFMFPSCLYRLYFEWNSLDERLLRKPITGIAGCWTRAAKGQVTAEPTTTLMKSRRRIAHPKARDYADFQSAITAGICDQRNGFRGLVCTAAIISPSCPLWV